MTYIEYLVRLEISAEEFQRLYRGQARDVLARDQQGRRIRFPAAALRRFVSHDGVRGLFTIRVDENHKLLDIVKKSV